MLDAPRKETLDVKACVKVVEGGVPETTALLKVIRQPILTPTPPPTFNQDADAQYEVA